MPMYLLIKDEIEKHLDYFNRVSWDFSLAKAKELVEHTASIGIGKSQL